MFSTFPSTNLVLGKFRRLLQENASADKLPTPLIVGSVLLVLALLIYLAYVLVVQARKRKHRPPEW